MYGYEEVYDSSTGRFIGAEVSEYLKVEGKDEGGTVKIDKKYDTFWFNLYDVSNFVDSIKAENKQNGMNMNTVYINDCANAIHSQWVINLAVSPTNPDTSRRFDIEMKDVYYVIKVTDGEKVMYKREKSSLPMLFVQDSVCKDRSGLSVKESTCVEEFGKNWVAKNYNKDETKNSGHAKTYRKLCVDEKPVYHRLRACKLFVYQGGDRTAERVLYSITIYRFDTHIKASGD